MNILQYPGYAIFTSLFGSQRDSFAHGVSDSLTGTVAQTEMINVIGQMKAAGWQQRRTLLFASWAASEYGLIGSYEWVKQMRKRIQNMYVILTLDDSV